MFRHNLLATASKFAVGSSDKGALLDVALRETWLALSDNGTVSLRSSRAGSGSYGGSVGGRSCLEQHCTAAVSRTM